MRGKTDVIDMTEIKLIRPSELKFCYNLSKHDCYRRYTGKCSLDEYFDKNIMWNSSIKSYHKKYCQILYVDIKKNGVIKPVEICKKACGHYDISNGQHRICISKKMDLIIPAYVGSANRKCSACFQKNNFKYWVKSLFKLNNIFVEK